jgi:hypothetical protein
MSAKFFPTRDSRATTDFARAFRSLARRALASSRSRARVGALVVRGGRAL